MEEHADEAGGAGRAGPLTSRGPGGGSTPATRPGPAAAGPGAGGAYGSCRGRGRGPLGRTGASRSGPHRRRSRRDGSTCCVLACCCCCWVLGVLGVLGPSRTAAAPATKPPNVVLVVADDLGFGEVGVLSGATRADRRIATPNLDGLAAEGMLFPHSYAGYTVSPCGCREGGGQEVMESSSERKPWSSSCSWRPGPSPTAALARRARSRR